MSRRLPTFPGELAGASLKHGDLGDVGEDGLDGFPRRTRRGLIEAGTCAPATPSLATPLSPANSPGPH